VTIREKVEACAAELAPALVAARSACRSAIMEVWQTWLSLRRM
jgi:hypothetical protein